MFGLKVQVTGPHPCALGDLGGWIDTDQLFPAVDGIAVVAEARWDEYCIVERQRALRMLGKPREKIVVGNRRFPVALAVEKNVRLVEIGRAQVRAVTGLGITGEHTFFGGDGQVILALARIGPGQKPVGPDTHFVRREFFYECREDTLRVFVTGLRSQRIGVDKKRPRPPRRLARRHLLQHLVRHTGELTHVARPVVRELQKTKRRLDQFLVVG